MLMDWTEFFKLALQGIIAGLVFLAGHYVLKFVIEPVIEQRKVFGDIINTLMFYKPKLISAPKFTDKEIEEIHNKIFGLSTKLISTLYSIPAYRALSNLGVLKSKEVVIEIARDLNLMSYIPYRREKDTGYYFSPEETLKLYIEFNKKLELDIDIINMVIKNDFTK